MSGSGSGSEDSSTTVVDTSEAEWALLEKEEIRIKKLLSVKQRSKDKDALRERVSKLRSKLDDFDNPPCESVEPKESSAAESSLVLDRRERERDQDSSGCDKERVRGNHRRERDEDVSRSPYHQVIAPSYSCNSKKLEPIILVKFKGSYRIKNQYVGSSSSSSSDTEFERSN